MARLSNIGFEMQSTTSGMEFTSVSVAGGSAAAISTGIKRSGNASIRFSNSGAAGGSYGLMDFLTADGNGPYYIRTYIYIVDLPDGNTSLLTIKNLADSSKMYVDLLTDGTLRLSDSGGVIGSVSSALSLNTWYRIETKYYNNTGTGKLELDVLIDGTSFASTTTSTNTSTVGRFRFGPSDSVGSYDIYMDDIAINDSTGSYQTSYPGAGSLVMALPTGAGDNAATTGIFSYINELPPSNTATSGSTMVELDANPTNGDYNVTDSNLLGIDTTDTISLVQVMARMREETSGVTNYTLRIRSASGGTTSSSSSLDVGDTTVRTNPSGTTAFANKHIAYVDPTTTAAWTPTGTNSIDNMQIGVGTTDGSPDTWCLWLGAYIEYVDVALALPYVVSSSRNFASSGTAISCPAPEGQQTGDVAVAIVHGNGLTTIVDNNGSTTMTEHINDYQPNTNAGHTMSVFSRRIVSGDPKTWNFTLGATGRWTVALLLIRNVGRYAIFDVSPDTANATATDSPPGSPSTVVVPSITTLSGNALHITCGLQDDATSVVSGVPSGYIMREIVGTQPLGVATKSITSAGATGTTTFTFSITAAVMGVSFSIRSFVADRSVRVMQAVNRSATY